MEYGRFVRTDIEMDDGGVRAIMRFDAEAIKKEDYGSLHN